MSSEETIAQTYQHVAPSLNAAVGLCYQSYIRALDEAEQKQMYKQDAFKAARRVYRRAMPPLSGARNIADFIACVTHGLLLEIFEPEEAARLFYAAQVAQSAAKHHQSIEESV